MKDLWYMLWTVFLTIFTLLLSKSYENDIINFQRDAFDRGFMEKVIDKNDKVTYKWKNKDENN